MDDVQPLDCPHVNSDFNFDDACSLRMKVAKTGLWQQILSEILLKDGKGIDKVTVDEEEQAVPGLETAVNVFWPSES